MSQQPAYRAFTVIKRDGQDDCWRAIGAAFRHEKGDGLNVILQALPIDGKIVLRPPKSNDESAQGDSSNVQSLRADTNKSRPRRG